MLLLATLNPSTTKEATQSLSSYFQQNSNGILDLFRFTLAETVEINVRLAGAIYLKNLIRGHWSLDPNKRDPEVTPVPISDEVRNGIRGGIVQAAVSAHPKLREHYAIAFAIIAGEDFPSRWPTLLNEVMAHVTNTQSFQSMDAGLLLLLSLVKKYEYKTLYNDEAADVREQVVNMVFPTLLQFGNSLLAHEGAEPWTLIHKLVKLAHSVLAHGRSLTYMLNTDNFSEWANFFVRVFSHPIPPQFVKLEDEDSDTMTVYWKPKKWVIVSMQAVLDRFGAEDSFENVQVSQAHQEMAKKFSKFFTKSVAPEFVRMVLDLLMSTQNGAYIPPRFVNNLLSFVDLALSEKALRKLMKPRVQDLMIGVLPSFLAVTRDDIALFTDEPVEYVRKFFDIDEEFFCPKAAARNVWIQLVKYYAAMRNLALNFCVTIIQSDPAGQRDIRGPEAAYTALGFMVDYFTSANCEVIVKLVCECTLPSLANCGPILKARIAWFLGQICGLEWEESYFAQIVAAVLSCFNPINGQPCPLPVRVQACGAINIILAENPDPAVVLIRPILSELLNQVFKMLDEVEIDELLHTLEALTGAFGEEIAPYAVELTQRLVQTFAKMVSNAEEDENGMTEYAASQALLTICSILQSVHSLKHIYPTLEAILFPMLDTLISPDYQSFIENTMEILTYLTFHSAEISDQIFGLYKKVFQAYHEWAGLEYIEDFVAPLDNLISRCTARFLANPEYVKEVFSIALEAVGAGEREATVETLENALYLFEPISQDCRGHCDEFVNQFLVNFTKWLYVTDKGTGQPRLVRNAMLQHCAVLVWCNAFYYNPHLAMNVLVQNNWLSTIIPLWSQYTVKLKKYNWKKICCLGLIGLLSLGPAIPQVLHSALGTMISTTVRLVHELGPLKIKREKQRKLIDENKPFDLSDDEEGGAVEEEDEDDDGFVDDENFDIDENPEQEEEQKEEERRYLRRLAKQAQMALTRGPIRDDDEKGVTGLGADFEDSDEEEDEEDPEDDFADIVNKPTIEDVDEKSALLHTIQAWNSNHSQMWNQLLASMAPADQQNLQNLFSTPSA